MDVTGRRIRTLVDSSLEAGRHVQIWRGHNDTGQQVSSGMYFYRQSGGGL